MPSAITEPTLTSNGTFKRYVKYSKSTLEIAGSPLTTMQRWWLQSASNEPICLKSVGDFIQAVKDSTNK